VMHFVHPVMLHSAVTERRDAHTTKATHTRNDEFCRLAMKLNSPALAEDIICMSHDCHEAVMAARPRIRPENALTHNRGQFNLGKTGVANFADVAASRHGACSAATAHMARNIHEFIVRMLKARSRTTSFTQGAPESLSDS
jgi:hypothetical protein